MFKLHNSLAIKVLATFTIFSSLIAAPVVNAAPVPMRIISLSPSATETLFAIGAGQQVIAVDDLSNYPLDAPMTKLSAFSPNVEALLNYRPDLIVLNADATKALEVKAALEKLEIEVFLEQAPNNLKEAYAQIRALGRVTGRGSGAQRTITLMKARINAAIKSAKKPKKISFLHELDETLYSATSQTFIGKVYKSFNLKNIADPAAGADSAGYPQLQAEYVIKTNPKILFLADAQYGESYESVSTRPGWSSISAVKNKNVIALPEDIPSRWGPRLADFYEFIATSLKKLN